MTRRIDERLGIRSPLHAQRPQLPGACEFVASRSKPVRPRREPALKRRIQGHFNYFGVSGNFRSLLRVVEQVRRAWYKWLCHRSHRKRLTWGRFADLLRDFPLPKPCIMVSEGRDSTAPFVPSVSAGELGGSLRGHRPLCGHGEKHLCTSEPVAGQLAPRAELCVGVSLWAPQRGTVRISSQTSKGVPSTSSPVTQASVWPKAIPASSVR